MFNFNKRIKKIKKNIKFINNYNDGDDNDDYDDYDDVLYNKYNNIKNNINENGIAFINKCIKYNNMNMLNEIYKLKETCKTSIMKYYSNNIKYKYFYKNKDVYLTIIFITKFCSNYKNIFITDYLIYLKNKKSSHYYEIENLLLLTYNNIDLDYFNNEKLILFSKIINKNMRCNINLNYLKNYDVTENYHRDLEHILNDKVGLFNFNGTHVIAANYDVPYIMSDKGSVWFNSYYNILLVAYFTYSSKKINEININDWCTKYYQEMDYYKYYDNFFIFYYYYVFHIINNNKKKCIQLNIYTNVILNFSIFIKILNARINNSKPKNKYFTHVDKYFIEYKSSISNFNELHKYLHSKNNEINIILFSKLIDFVKNNITQFICSNLADIPNNFKNTDYFEDYYDIDEKLFNYLKKYICILISKLVKRKNKSKFDNNIIKNIQESNLFNCNEYLNYIEK